MIFFFDTPKKRYKNKNKNLSKGKLEGGRVRPKAKKRVTSPTLMAEVVADVPKGTSDGSARV